MSDIHVRVEPSLIHGQGVFAQSWLECGDTQVIHGRKVCPADQYCFEEGEKMGGSVGFKPYAPYRFLNHSNHPNCEVWTDDDGRYFLTVLTDIGIGEELTIDYGFDPGKEGTDEASTADDCVG